MRWKLALLSLPVFEKHKFVSELIEKKQIYIKLLIKIQNLAIMTLKVKKITTNYQMCTKFLNLQNSLKKGKFKDILFLNSTLEELSNDTTHDSLRLICISAKIDWTKNKKKRFSIWFFRL